jgi:hypothetical protein
MTCESITDDSTVQELLQRVERRSPASKADLDALRGFSPACCRTTITDRCVSAAEAATGLLTSNAALAP